MTQHGLSKLKHWLAEIPTAGIYVAQQTSLDILCTHTSVEANIDRI